MIDDGKVLYDLGVDLSSNLSFTDGDLNLISYKDNLFQSIINRLNTDLNELDLFYEDYGSVLSSFFGWKVNDETLSYMEAEIENVLDKDPRIRNIECKCNYTGKGRVVINLTIYPLDNDEISFNENFVLNENGIVELEINETENNEE